MARRTTLMERRQKRYSGRVQALVNDVLHDGLAPIAYVVDGVYRHGQPIPYAWNVRCPYCDKIHMHASHEGMRQSHCSDLRLLDGVTQQYFIRLPKGLKLTGVSSPSTKEHEIVIEQIFVEAIRRQAEQSKG